MTGDRVEDTLDDVTILTKDYLPPSACAPNDGLDLSSAAGGRKSTSRRCCSNKLNLPMFVTVVCVLFFAESMCSNGLIGATMSTVEKRYGIRSAQSGWIPSSYELTGIPIMVLVGVIGSRVHRPRCMAFAGLVSALGALLYTLPHFIAGPHNLHNQGHEQHYCRSDGNITSTCLHDNSVSTSSQLYLSIFILASMFMSFGAGPMYVMGSAYIDDTASPGQSAFYIGITKSMSSFGPAVGFLATGYLLRIPADIGRSFSENELTLSPDDRGWVGAWWLGYVACALLGLLACPFMALFPRTASSLDESQSTKIVSDLPVKPSFVSSLPSMLCSLMCNGMYMFCTLADAVVNLLIAGFQTFGPKYVETQFRLSSATAAALFGVVCVPGAVGGNLFGGWLIKRRRLDLRGLLRYYLAGKVLLLAVIWLPFIIHCDPASTTNLDLATLGNMSCSTHCGCDMNVVYEPVCGEDGVSYMSPCQAACTHCRGDACTDCACVQGQGQGRASKGMCGEWTCGVALTLFLVVFFVAMFITLTLESMATLIVFRSVEQEFKAAAIGISWTIQRLLGTMPGPVIFGWAMDTSCTLWQSTCHVTGSCQMYSSRSMAWLMVILGVSCMCVCVALALAALVSHIRWSRTTASYTPPSSSDVVVS